ncbi:MAG TPA: class I SAM-dependent methyltransferase [Casimicrobiaceae bacterium]|nr:class I SAM-dependent methyltransferase [Casimicrobiaceae bacterium]
MLPFSLHIARASLLVLVATTAVALAQTAPQPAQKAATKPAAAAPAKELRAPDVVFVPTPEDVVDAMLKVAKVGKGDVLYDLGSGDGRIPITAAQKYNIAKGVGIDINPERVKEANENLAKTNIGNRVKFINADLFESDFRDATVVTLYLLPELNLKLLPKLLKETKPGTRVVSHAFDMGSWKPEQKLDIGGRSVYFWRIPKPGTAEYEAATKASAGRT